MKAIVLCAGEGTRLRPLTFSGPKHLIPVANRPVIYRVLDAIKEAKIEDVGIIVSPNVRNEFECRLKDGSFWDLNIEYIIQEKPQGLAHAVQCARDFVQEESFLVYLGDNLLQYGLKDMVGDFDHLSCNALISIYEVQDPQRFGIVTLEGNEIKNLVEKPVNPKSNLAVIGTYLFDGHIFEAINRIKPSARGELEITDAIQTLIDCGYKVSPHQVKGWWKDVGKPEDMLEVNQLIMEGETQKFYKIEGQISPDSILRGRVRVAKTARVENSELRGPCIIGEGAEISDSFIGPFTSIGGKVKIAKSEIEYSIIMEKSQIMGVKRLDHSLIGKNVQIGQKEKLPEAYSVVLGDNSKVDFNIRY